MRFLFKRDRSLQHQSVKRQSATALITLYMFAVGAFSATFSTAQAQAPWRNVQISGSGCWVTGIVAQPKVPGLFYIRTDVGGCYRWNPAAGAWVPITEFLPLQKRNDYGCISIAVDPISPDTVYIACGTWMKG